jgi:hypothetical protein
MLLRAALVMVATSLGAAGCPSQTTGGQGGGVEPGTGNGTGGDSKAISPEQMEEVQRTARIGKDSIIKCFTEEMERTKDKKLTGKLTLKLQVGTNRVADQVQIDSTLKSPAFQDCVMRAVKSWEFPQIPTAGWFTFPYELSPAY